MGISCLLESNFPTLSSCCTEQEENRGKTLINPKNPNPRVGFWVSQGEQQKGKKNHTQKHTLSTPGYSAQSIRDHREIKLHRNYLCFFFFFSVFSPLFECLCTARWPQPCECLQNHSAVLELNVNTSIFPSQQQRGEPAATKAKGKIFWCPQ